MKSRASMRSHPIHPMLVSLPIGLWTGSLVYDLWAASVADEAERQRLRHTADEMLLAGLAGAIAAAVPGAIDYFAVVPPKSSAWNRGAMHGVLNLSLAALYGANYLMRRGLPERWGRRIGVPLSVLGFGGLLCSGWLGGTLVYRNQIGVDHRGPNAAKWEEGDPLTGIPGELVEVAQMEEFEKSGQMKLVHLNHVRIVVARSGERMVAFQDHCTHKGGPLADGVLACGAVTCPWHGSQFNVETGEVVSGPTKEKIRIFPVQVDGDRVLVAAPDLSDSATEDADELQDLEPFRGGPPNRLKPRLSSSGRS